MNLMNELLDCLSSISYEVFDEDYINELLDNRDDDLFDSEWCRVFKEIEALKNIQNYTDKVKKEQHKIREKAFMIIIENNADSELATYITDDFGLIYDSFVLNYHDEWLNKLIEAYKNRKIPTGEL